jgi:hypothetical protein
MARAIRVEYAGAFYHVMALGNQRERIFRDARAADSETISIICENVATRRWGSLRFWRSWFSR